MSQAAGLGTPGMAGPGNGPLSPPFHGWYTEAHGQAGSARPALHSELGAKLGYHPGLLSAFLCPALELQAGGGTKW